MNTTLRSLLASLLAVLTLGLAGCGLAGGKDTDGPLVVMADATPHTEILQKVQELGLLGDTKLEIKTISGDVDVNQLTRSGDVDANFFQHVPYLTSWNQENGSSELVAVAPVHVEPLGLYSRKVTSLAAVRQGATVAIPSDPSNLVRALFLLQQAGVLTLDVKPTDKDIDYTQVSEKNITANPKDLHLLKIDRPQLAATLDDAKVDLSVINGNYALEAGLTPASDSLELESAVDNPYANVLVVTAEAKDDPRVAKLAEALRSTQVQEWIKSNYRGSVLPAAQS